MRFLFFDGEMEVAHLPLLHKTSGRQWRLSANLFHTHTHTRRTGVLDIAKPSNQQLSHSWGSTEEGWWGAKCSWKEG